MYNVKVKGRNSLRILLNSYPIQLFYNRKRVLKLPEFLVTFIIIVFKMSA